MTPTREEIIKKARELWRQDRLRSNQPCDLIPEETELAEEGFLVVARQELMRSESMEYRDYIVKEYNEVVLSQKETATTQKDNPQIAKPTRPTRQAQPLDYDYIDAILREGCFVTGARGSGKSTLVMQIASRLMAYGVKVKVVDSSRVWLKKSALPYYVSVSSPALTKYHAVWNLPNAWNCIYDVSKLTVKELRAFTSGMMTIDFQDYVRLDELGFEVKACYILEECQNLVPSGSLRSGEFGEISRFVTQGRNYGLSYIAITQRLASVDTNLIEISGLHYFGKLEGENTVRKAKAWLGKEWLETVRDLDVSEFLVQYGSQIDRQRMPYYQCLSKPQELTEEMVYQYQNRNSASLQKKKAPIPFSLLLPYVEVRCAAEAVWASSSNCS